VGSLWRHRDGHKLPTTVPQGAVTLPTVGDQAVSLIGAAEVALSNGKAVITVIPGVVGRWYLHGGAVTVRPRTDSHSSGRKVVGWFSRSCVFTASRLRLKERGEIEMVSERDPGFGTSGSRICPGGAGTGQPA
jgi:hypothetical protein